MLINSEVLQIALIIAAAIIAASAISAVFILATIRGEIVRALKYSEVMRPQHTVAERIARIEMQSKTNQELIETEAGRNALVDFFISESNISGFFREAEEHVIHVETYEQLQELLAQLRKPEKKNNGYLERFKKGAKAIGGKLFDKANDLVKPYIGGKSTES